MRVKLVNMSKFPKRVSHWNDSLNKNIYFLKSASHKCVYLMYLTVMLALYKCYLV